MNNPECASEGNQVFIIDEGIIENFLKDENYERAELFFIYLSAWCQNKKALIVPSTFDKIKDVLLEKSKLKGEEKQAEVIAYFENWCEKAELLGKEDNKDEKYNTEFLHRLQSLLHPNCDVIIISNKFKSENKYVKIILIEDLGIYLQGKSAFKEYINKEFGLGEYDGSY